MSADEKQISITVRASSAIRALSNLGEKFVGFGSVVGKSDKQLRALERMLAVAEGTINKSRRTVEDLKNELAIAGKEATQFKNKIKTLESRNAALDATVKKLRMELRELRATNKALEADNERLAKSLLNVGVQGKTGLGRVRKGAKEAGEALESLDENFQINALRYALYDVTNSLSRIRDLGRDALGGIFGAGIDFDRNFANVVRTAQVSNPEEFEDTRAAVNALRVAFIDLQSTLPVTSEELTRIGTLAAQMGIAANEVAGFTEVTAKFSAASGISADESAIALARIGQMLSGDVQNNYERLASAILKTGVNAIATEQQIVRGTTQIAAIGKVAGFSATDIIALSSAMSSLGMSPELQRSIVTSSFTKILTSVRGSAEEAAKFGAILGQTGKEFQQAWEGDGYNTYRKLLAAIAESPNAIGILKELGLASQRLTPNLLKLGQAYGLLGETKRDTEKGWRDEIELQRQYEVILETTASKLQILEQAWQGLLTVIGSGAVDAIGDTAEFISKLVKELQKFARSPIGQVISTLVIGFLVLGTALASVMTFVTLAGASLLGFDFVVTQLMATVASGTGVLGGFSAGLTSITAASRAAAFAVKALVFSLKLAAAAAATGVVITVAYELDDPLTQLSREVTGIDGDMSNRIKQLIGEGGTSAAYSFTKAITSLGDGWIDFSRSLGSAAGGPWDNIKKVDEALADMVGNGDTIRAKSELDKLRDSWVAAGHDADGFRHAFVDTYSALSLVSGKTEATTEEIDNYVNGMEDAMTEEARHEAQLASMASALGLITGEFISAEDALTDFTDAFASGAGDFFKLDSLLGDDYKDIATIQSYYDKQLAAAELWADGLSELVTRGAGSVAAAFAAEGPSAQAAIVGALALGPDELATLNQSMRDAAFFASKEYAAAFAADNAFLADVYKKALAVNPETVMEALHAAQDALAAGLNTGNLSALEAEFGIDIDASLTPVTEADLDQATSILRSATITAVEVPVVLRSPRTGEDNITKVVEAYQVSLNGQTIVIPVDPKTEEGAALLKTWVESASFNNTLEPGVDPDVAKGREQLRLWRLAEEKDSITIPVYIKQIGTVTLPAPQQVRRNGGGMGIPGFARGTDGPIMGPGTSTSDSILARLSKGEFVIRAAAVKAYGPEFMRAINDLRFPKYAAGGWGGPSYGPGRPGPERGVHIEVTQMYPTTRDPIRKLKSDAESVLAGIWTD